MTSLSLLLIGLGHGHGFDRQWLSRSTRIICIIHPTGWMMGCMNETWWIHTPGWTMGCSTGWMFAYTIQPVVHLVWQPVASRKQPSNRLYHVNRYKNNWSYYLAEYEQNTNSYAALFVNDIHLSKFIIMIITDNNGVYTKCLYSLTLRFSAHKHVH